MYVKRMCSTRICWWKLWCIKRQLFSSSYIYYSLSFTAFSVSLKTTITKVRTLVLWFYRYIHVSAWPIYLFIVLYIRSVALNYSLRLNWVRRNECCHWKWNIFSLAQKYSAISLYIYRLSLSIKYVLLLISNGSIKKNQFWFSFILDKQ